MSLVHLFKKVKHSDFDIISYWVIGAGSYIEKTWNLSRVFQTDQIALAYICQLVNFGDFMSSASKNVFKDVPCLLY